jgi:hypothetical protein
LLLDSIAGNPSIDYTTLMGLEELAFNLFVAAAVLLSGFLGAFLIIHL